MFLNCHLKVEFIDRIGFKRRVILYNQETLRLSGTPLGNNSVQKKLLFFDKKVRERSIQNTNYQGTFFCFYLNISQGGVGLI